jgi:hypothetical protein
LVAFFFHLFKPLAPLLDPSPEAAVGQDVTNPGKGLLGLLKTWNRPTQPDRFFG